MKIKASLSLRGSADIASRMKRGKIIILIAAAFVIYFMVRTHNSSMSLTVNSDVGGSDRKGNQKITTAEPYKATVFYPNVAAKYSEDLARLAIAPVWSCLNGDDKLKEQIKVAFVHVFKTAGSTMRDFFKEYAKSCPGKGWVTVIGCSDATAESIRSDNFNWSPCVAKEMITREGKFNWLSDYIKSQKRLDNANDTLADNNLLERNVDMYGGHMQLGTGDFLKNREGKLVKTRYITFFRDPVPKYVSGVLYDKRFLMRNKTITRKEIIECMKTEVKAKILIGSYSVKYFEYFQTPFQKEFLRENNIEWSWEEMTNVVMRNLVEYNVIAGVVEHMPASMKILHHALDHEKQIPKLFEEEIRSNGAGYSTSDVVDELKTDKEFFELLNEYVKYERMIYEFGLKMHEQQYAALFHNN
mmetsp:Transcript_37054/g.44270  ORF Transcript_37054/g.44270 Transcript_37054/m.44270 type:complete len:414 (+) Transcript_37054:43-1284(+)